MAAIVDLQWQPRNYEGNFIVLGDFNDYEDPETSLTALLEHSALVNVVRRLPPGEQWTHYFAGGDEYRQLDYLLLSETLADANPASPTIMRKGLAKRATEYTGPRFSGVGQNHPKASDHAPVVMELELT